MNNCKDTIKAYFPQDFLPLNCALHVHLTVTLKNRVFLILRDFILFAKLLFLQQETPIGKSTDNRMKEIDKNESGLVIHIY